MQCDQSPTPVVPPQGGRLLLLPENRDRYWHLAVR